MTGPSCGDDNTYLRFDSVLDDKPLARCFRIHGRKVWIQKRYIRDQDATFVVVPTWLAKSKQVSSYY